MNARKISFFRIITYTKLQDKNNLLSVNIIFYKYYTHRK